MFNVGEYVVYGSKGVCQVSDISHVDIPGADADRLYYILRPVGDTGATVYLPTDNQKAVIRRVMTQEEARQLLDDMPSIEQLWVEDEKKREQTYKDAMKTCDSRMWVSMIKTLYNRKQDRLAMGKKITALDEKYMRAAEHELYDELSIVLDLPREQMAEYITEYVEGK